ncbi:hypothetical protein [Lentzea sp. CA-135723]|uniref:hypothetical protein n=1 Tax=Lentzea sp. CA-135723 TaxID=3239950 RepID=UPI003D8A8FAC
MKRAHAIWLVAAAVVVAAGTITLADRNEVAAAPPAVGEVRPVHSALDIALPLDRYQHSPADLTTIDRATAVLARRCLHDFGQAWSPPDPPPVPASTGSSRYGLADPDRAARSGYHPPQDAPRQPEDRPEPAPDAMMIYTGKGTTSVGGKRIPEGGCLGQARRELERGVPVALPAAELIRLDQEMFEQAQRDDRVRQAMADWRQCMSASGYDYADVWAANNDIRWESETPSQAEIDTARTDVTCRQRTGIVGTWLAVETAYQRRAIAERAEQFDALERGMRVRVGNATAALATG